MRALLVARVLASAVQLQQPPRDMPAPAAKPPAGSGVIRGRVVTADTGTPIHRAVVSVFGPATMRTFSTDARGRYEARDLPAGSYLVRAQPGPSQHRYGRFVLAGLPAGRYYVIALPRDRMLPGQRVDPSVIERLILEATAFSLGDGEARQVDVGLAPRAGGSSGVDNG